jgi:DegV family protein with EDD domain
MPPVALVTDTTNYMPRELREANDIHEVSLYVNSAERQQRESEVTDFEAFYRRLRDGADLPTTSQPSIGDFLAVYEPLAEAGHDIVSVHLPGGISGTVDSARQAAEELGRSRPSTRIKVIDGRTACGGLGMLLLAGAASARAGGNVDQVAARVRAASEAIKIWFALDTLEFLRRGGRVGPAQAWLGGALKIKPILSIGDEIAPIERVRTSGRAFERMVDYLRSRSDDGADAWVVQHIQAPGEAQRLVERGREIFGSEPLFVSEVGAVIGVHAGPGMIGVGGFPSSLLDDTTP